MSLSRTRNGVRIAVLLSWIASFVVVGGKQAVQAAEMSAPAAPLDTPYTLVTSGVRQFTTSSVRVVWHALNCEDRPPGAKSETPAATAVEKIARIAAQGSETRTLYVQAAVGYCNALGEPIKSNLAADGTHVYWNTAQGLRRLSLDANLGDAPTLHSAATASASDVELATSSTYIYALVPGDGTVSANTKLWRIAKSNGAATLLYTIGAVAGKLQISQPASRGAGGNYAYWLQGQTLTRLDLDAGIGRDNPTTIATNVTAYYAEGGRSICIGAFCTTTDYVFYSSGAPARFLNRLENSTLVGTQIYDGGSAKKTIYEIVATSSNLFFLMEDATPCTPQPCFGGTYIDSLVRTTRSGGSPAVIAVSGAEYLTPQSAYTNLRVASSYVMWLAGDDILRLPLAAVAVPNMKITGMSVTQGIQKPGSYPQVEKGVFLIQGRRTFVRVFVKSDGANVPGVTARLRRLANGGEVIDSVVPVNDVGSQLTVRKSPARANLNDSFLFEIPMTWLPKNSSDKLYLRADLNPYQAPTEPSYSDNQLLSGPLAFLTSPALKVQFVSWGYKLGNQVYWPRFVKDVIQTYSWLIRAYPIASKIIYDGGAGSQPGLHPNLWLQYDDSLGSRVNRTHPDCGSLENNLCASAYTNAQMDAMRTDEGIPLSRFFYGLISDAAGEFPRGQACCGTNVSSGPAGKGTWGWDTDGSYTDWYAAHEIGHTLGRAHPTASAVTCENSASDDNYPYTGAQIGPNNDTEGFDAGAPAYGVPRAVYPGTTWYDVMSYCSNQWISDYTYEGMHSYMLTNPSRPAGDESAARAWLDGDFLKVSGRLYTSAAVIEHLWRSTSVESTSVPTSGGYAIRLFDAADVQLSEHAFAAEPPDDAPHLTFHQVIPFAAGTRMVKIVRTSDGTVLGTQAVSANAPVVSDVALAGVAEPITGTVTLNWNAADADGDALTYAVRYSTDGGATWVGAVSGVTDTTTTVDTTVLAGGSGRFRVVASDGVNTGSADSADYAVQAKAPLPMILSPAGGARLQYGQPVHFNGAAFDWQAGGVPSENLVWTSSLSGLLGVGEQFDGLNLPVGEHLVTLVATNTAGLTASASITLVVEDNLEPPGPTLTAGPSSFYWQTARNAMDPVTDTLYIGNAGSGTVNWSATTDAPWLTLSISAGTEDDALVLTADPSGVTNGTAVTGTLTLTMAATDDAPAQTIVVQVGLSRGFDWNDPTGYTELKRVYVPVTVR